MIADLDTQLASVKTIAAAWARGDDDFIVIARTDAMSTLGLDAAIGRANTYLEAGADVAIVGVWPPRSTLLPSNSVRWSIGGGSSQSASLICPLWP